MTKKATVAATASAPGVTIEELRSSAKAVLNRTEVAAVLGVDPRTVTKAIDDGAIPALRLGRRVLIPREKFLDLFDSTRLA